MKRFRYKAYDASGGVKQGEILAVSQASAKFKLKENGLILVSISDIDRTNSRFTKQFKINFNPGIDQIEALSSRLALLLKNGIKVDKAIEFAVKGIQNSKLSNAMDEVHEDIRKGIRLTDSLEKHPDIFDSLYISRVRVGEDTGNLGQAFIDITENLNFHKNILSKTRQALLYPLIIFLVCVGSILFIFNFIIPRFSVIFSNANNLPSYTKMLMATSDFFRHYQFFVLPLILLAGWGLFVMKDHDAVKRVRFWLAANLPIIKKTSLTLENLRFASALSMLLSSGVVLSDALTYAIDSVSNTFIKKKLVLVKNRVRQGENLSAILSDAGFLPDMFQGLVEVGEQAGSLGEIFKEMEIRLRADYEKTVAGVITLIEPIMIVVMGFIVGSVVVGLLLSMVSVNDMAF